MAKKGSDTFKEFNENLAKAFHETSDRFRQQIEKAFETQRQAVKSALKMSPNLEEFNRQVTTAFRASGEQFRKGLEQALGAQRDAMRKMAPSMTGWSELPIAQMGKRFREAALEAIGTEQKVFADSARDLAKAFEKLAGESMKAISEVTRRTFEEIQKGPAATTKPANRPKPAKKRRASKTA
ncbi:MAG: hypothetical protein ABSD31_09305 [Candidatus Binataceae bacterium]|jgi:BMFP domain-containing protein YqiC